MKTDDDDVHYLTTTKEILAALAMSKQPTAAADAVVK